MRWSHKCQSCKGFSLKSIGETSLSSLYHFCLSKHNNLSHHSVGPQGNSVFILEFQLPITLSFCNTQSNWSSNQSFMLHIFITWRWLNLVRFNVSLNFQFLFQKRRYIVFDTWNTSLNMVRGSWYGVESSRGKLSCSVVCCKYNRSQSKMKTCENNQTYGKISHAELNDTRGRSFGTKHFPLVVVTILRILFQVRRFQSVSIFSILVHPCSFTVYRDLFRAFLS